MGFCCLVQLGSFASLGGGQWAVGSGQPGIEALELHYLRILSLLLLSAQCTSGMPFQFAAGVCEFIRKLLLRSTASQC